MSEQNTFQPEIIPFRMMGTEYNYEFIPSFHLQEVMIGVTQLLTSFDFQADAAGNVSANLKESDDQLLTRLVEVVRDLLSKRIYQVIADILQHQNGIKVSAEELRMKTRPTEIADFLAIVMNDAEIYEAIATLGKSMAGLMGKMAQIKSP